MSVFKKVLVIFLLSFGLTSYTNASNLSEPRLESAYDRFLVKVESQLSESKKLILLEKLGNKIDIFFDTKDLSERNQLLLSDLNKLNNEELFNIYFQNNKANTQSQVFQYSSTDAFKLVSQNQENIFLENGVWYFYDYKATNFFEEDNVDLATLSYNNINPDTDLLVLREAGGPGFVTDFQKVKLITDDIIYGIPDKYEFLKEVRNDQRHIRIDNTDEIFLDMKQQTVSILSSSKKQDKIADVYDWVLANLQYTENFDIEDRRIFSGSKTYLNKDGVCEGYTKVMTYMLNFAGVRDSIVIRGDVIDAIDFPRIGHAWVRVGQDFYDPTFDDPIGATETRTPDNYRYYKLPKDLMYTNRYDSGKTPKALESTNLKFREDLVGTKLFSLTSKYSSDDYLLLGPSEFRKILGLTFSDDITFDDIKKQVPYLEVQSNFSTELNGKPASLQGFQYYLIEKDGSNIESLLNQLDYDLAGYYAMKFNTDEGFEYRLAYNVKFR